MSLSFEKYQGLGNDFIFIDKSSLGPFLDPLDIQSLCDRHFGIGADGVILVDISSSVRMEIYNSDGSLAEMCGNALRCLYLYLKNKQPNQDTFTVHSFEHTHELSCKDGLIECTLGDVDSIEWNLSFDLQKRVFQGHFLNTGVPHLVVLANDLHHLPILPLGSALRHHPHFQPAGTNVNFISLNAEKEVEIRTYERGVEGETKACGTGCAASAIVAKILFNLKGPISVQPSSGQKLFFDFHYDPKAKKVSALKMRGEARFVFEGSIELEASRKKVVLTDQNV